MPANLFWLDDKLWAAIMPLLPVNQRGPKRIEDRQVLSGIIHVLSSGCPWRACPDSYGPYMTVFNRYNRWKKRGIWQRIVAVLPDDLQAKMGPTDSAVDDPGAPRTARSSLESMGLAGFIQTKTTR